MSSVPRNDILCIIPARGGSKAIPKKNIRLLAGKPLLAYTIETALVSRMVGRVIVSTDDNEIAMTAIRYGAEVVRRPVALASDTATSEDALLHALDTLQANEQYRPLILLFLQCTSPLRDPSDIDGALRRLIDGGYDSILSVCRRQRFMWSEHDGVGSPSNYDYRKRPRRQEQEPTYAENGSIYAMYTSILREKRNRLGGKIGLYEMPEWKSFEIDTEEDWALVETLMRNMTFGHKPDLGMARETLANIKLLVLDFDGVMTDNRVLVSEDGREFVFCNRTDGFGLELLQRAGLEAVVLSAEQNVVVETRCRKLGVECHYGVKNKIEQLRSLSDTKGIPLSQIAYVGNDLNDIECIRSAGLGIAVSDACSEVISAADLVTTRPGGSGAVREVIELIINAERH